MTRIVIVGGSFAGVAAADAARSLDPGASITVIGAEPYLAYNRPRLTYIIGKGTPVESFLMHPASWYEERNIKFVTGRKIVAGGPGTVTDSAGATYDYDSLVLATGGVSAMPPLPGANLSGVFSLRTYDDEKAIETYVRDRKSVAIIGGGLVGLETAWALSQWGKQVYVLDRGNGLLKNQLDADGMKIAGEIVEGKGVTPVYEADTQEIVKSGDSLAIVLKDGRRIEADAIILSTGVKSEITLAKTLGLRVNRGVIVDDHMAVSPGIFAAGDVAEFNGKTGGIYPVAVEQGKVAGQNAAGGNAVYREITPANTTMLMGIALFSAGDTGRGEGPYATLQSSTSKEDYKKLYLKDGRLVGAILIGAAARKALKVKALIDSGEPLGGGLLAATSAEEFIAAV